MQIIQLNSIIVSRYKVLFSLLLLLAIAVPFYANTQQISSNQVEQQLNKKEISSFQEKLFLHTDKEFYVAGEIIWFKIYYLDAGTHMPLHASKVAYVEIIDRQQKPVLQAKVALTEAGGNGSFYLPTTLAGDNYTIRAYTQWMKNFDASLFFHKTVSVANTIKAIATKEKKDSVTASVQFFPEAGNLVEGIETKVAFRILDQYGKGIPAAGIITDEKNDTVIQFTALHAGIGNFKLTPQSGKTYKAVVALSAGKKIEQSLPRIYSSGYVMNITDNNDGRFKVSIRAKATADMGSVENILLLAHTRKITKVAQYASLVYGNELVLYIDKNKLEAGVSHVTLFNKQQQPVCERLVFIHPAQQPVVNAAMDKTIYSTRQKATVLLSAAENIVKIDSGQYSVAVYQTDELAPVMETDIVTYLWLTSELQGKIEAPAFYFSKGKESMEAVDNLLLTQGWRRFKWEELLTNKKRSISFVPEYRGHLITGKVTKKATGQPAAGIDCFLSFPAAPFGFYAAKSDSKGMVYFDVKNYFGPGDIIPQAYAEDTTTYRIDIATPFADQYADFLQPPLYFKDEQEEGLLSRSIAMQAQNVYSTDSIKKFIFPVQVDTGAFYGKPEYTFRLDEYKRFTTIEEVLREYVPFVNVVLKNGNLYMNIYDEPAKRVYETNALVLLDGVPLKNYNKMFSYDALKVAKLDVIPRRYLFGGTNFSGIISFQTYNGRFDGFELDPSIVTVDYEGLQLQREFYSPVYDSKEQQESRLPDFRTTLYWKPDITGSADKNIAIPFFTSDQKGKFLVLLQGITNKGQPVSATTSFNVQ